MFAKHDGLRVWDELRGVQSRQKRIGRRAVRTAFRGEQLDQDWLAGGGCGSLLSANGRLDGDA